MENQCVPLAGAAGACACHSPLAGAAGGVSAIT